MHFCTTKRIKSTDWENRGVKWCDKIFARDKGMWQPPRPRPLCVLKKADFSPWQMKSDFSYFDSESIRRHISVCVFPLIVYSPYLNGERGDVAGHPRCPDGLQLPGAKARRVETPLCALRVPYRVRLVRTSSVSWIFKLDIKGAKSPHERALHHGYLATGSRRASRGRRDFRGRVWSIHDVLESRFAVKNSREFRRPQNYERNEKFGRKIPYVLIT